MSTFNVVRYVIHNKNTVYFFLLKQEKCNHIKLTIQSFVQMYKVIKNICHSINKTINSEDL